MVKATLTLLQVIIAANAVLLKNDLEFTHIGSHKSEAGAHGRNRAAFDENDYYISVFPTVWANAVADCKNVFGGDATLVAIESEEEWDFLKDNLQFYGGTTYWTSGMYDPSSTAWRWEANSQHLPPFAPWGSGYPSNPNTNLRVLINYTNRFDAFWRTVANSQSHRYICEVQKTTVAVPCYRTNDLIVVLDSSGSIGHVNYEIAKSFVDELAAAFTRHSASRFAFLIYSNNAFIIIDIRNTLSPAEISSTILATHYMAGGTATDLGIDLAIEQFNSSPRQVPLNMVILTDGQSNNQTSTAEAAHRAINLGIRTLSVGITDLINYEELLTIAGGESKRIFTTANFEELIKLLAPLSLKICPD